MPPRRAPRGYYTKGERYCDDQFINAQGRKVCRRYAPGARVGAIPANVFYYPARRGAVAVPVPPSEFKQLVQQEVAEALPLLEYGEAKRAPRRKRARDEEPEKRRVQLRLGTGSRRRY